MRIGIIGYGKMGKIRKQSSPEFFYFYPADNEIQAEAILDDEDIDAVIICTPNCFSKKYVLAALEKGKHVFCEKPPGMNLTELNEIVECEKRHPNLKLMFGFNLRHHESMKRAKQVIDSGEYGKVLWMRGRYGKSVDDDFLTTWRANKDMAGGGILLDQGIHMVDLFLMMVEDFDEVKAFISNLYWNLDIEDNVFAILRNAKGQVASLHSTMTQWRHLFCLEIFLEKGYITINGLKTESNSYGDEVMTIAKNRTTSPKAEWTTEENLRFNIDNSWQSEMDMFINAIKNNKPVTVGNTTEALKVMKLIDKIYKEAQCKHIETHYLLL